MKEDYSELIEYLDQKFASIDGNLLTLNEKIIAMDEKLETKADKDDVNNLLTAVDGYAKKADTFFQEMVALSHKVDRHERWFHEIADKLGVKLEY